MNIRHWPTALLLLLINAPVNAVTHSVGVARDVNNQELRYIEHHQYFDNGRHLVRYYDGDQGLLLEKEMLYPGLPQHPDVRHTDYLNNIDIEIRAEATTATIIRRQGEKQRSFSFELSEDIIIDAGFNTYIRSNWEAFKQGDQQQVKFAVAGQERLLTMNIRSYPRKDGGLDFTIAPANLIVKLLLSPINLTYDADKQLMRYTGFSNLKQPQASSREVSISFSHFELDSSLSGPLNEWFPKNVNK